MSDTPTDAPTPHAPAPGASAPDTNVEARAVAERLGLTADAACTLELVLESLFSFDFDGMSLESMGPASESASIGRVVPALPDLPPLDPDRYRDLGLLGEGGMGVVRRVYDEVLGRTVALKTLRPERTASPSAVHRFVREARATSRLQHPGIVPVHDLGVLPDGRIGFTMPEITGETLEANIRRAHDGGLRREALHRLVASVARSAEAVAYAHESGCLHRDLKPANIMLGRFGEVYVLDWGLVHLGAAGDLVEGGSEFATVEGAVFGTPAFMAPEQAAGDRSAEGPATDVYGLGGVLFTVLCGRAPFSGDPAWVRLQVLAGTPVVEPVVPAPELVAICRRCLAPSPAARYADAGELAVALDTWLTGALQQEKADQLLEEVRAQSGAVAALRTDATRLAAEAGAEASRVPTWADEAERRSVWRLQDQAQVAREEAEALDLVVEQQLQLALQHVPQHAGAHAALAGRARADQEAAETSRDWAQARRAEARLRSHTDALPGAHPDRRQHLTYLEGIGALSLVTEPVGATATLFRYQVRDRRLHAVHVADLGTTPIREHALEPGSYRVELKHPGCQTVLYPVHIGRGEHWHGCAPGESAPRPIVLPAAGLLGPDERYVPPGWAWIGGDDEAFRSLPRRRVWVEGFVIQCLPVCNRSWLEFANDLLAQGRPEDAERCLPRSGEGQRTGDARSAYQLGSDGRYALGRDAEGHLWTPQLPVCYVDQPRVLMYVEWLRSETGRPWRLLGELEWEKAGRGADGRCFPFGDAIDPSWASLGLSCSPPPLPVDVGARPSDVSVYGVRDLAGTIRATTVGLDDDAAWSRGPAVAPVPDWPPTPESQLVLRGGAWGSTLRLARLANRGRAPWLGRSALVGVRLGRSWPE
jgi:eukaryotic-like serine/threonine-protein kinase